MGSKRCNPNRAQLPLENAVAEQPRPCKRPPLVAKFLRFCGFWTGIQTAWCRPGLLRDMRPGPNLVRRFRERADRACESAWKTKETRRFLRARRRECRRRLSYCSNGG